MSTGFITKGDMNKGISSMTTVMTKYIAPLGGGVAGFVAADSFLGVRNLFSSLIAESGIADALPIVGSIDISAFIAAAVYATGGAVISTMKFGGNILGALFTALSWYCYGAALRLAITGLVTGFSTISATVVA